jgi:hypothetical protein
MRGILTLTALSLAFIKLSLIGQNLPRTTYNTALDVWNGVNLTFLFVALAEFVLVHYLSTHKFGVQQGSNGGGNGSGSGSGSIRRHVRGSSVDDIEMSRTKTMVEEQLIEPENFEVEQRRKSVQVQTHWTRRLVPEKIEKWTMILYPSIYVGFNFVYWLVVSNQVESSYR